MFGIIYIIHILYYINEQLFSITYVHCEPPNKNPIRMSNMYYYTHPICFFLYILGIHCEFMWKM